jgi:hypothetical protein
LVTTQFLPILQTMFEGRKGVDIGTIPTEAALGPLNPPWNIGRVGLVLLRGNDVPAKLGRLPRGNVTAPETPKVCLGNSINLDAVHAGGDPCRFGAPVIKTAWR